MDSYNRYRYFGAFFFSLFFLKKLSRETSSRKYDIIDDDDDDDVSTFHTREQNTCEDYIPLARRRKKKKEIGREKKISSCGPDLKEKKEKRREDEIEEIKRGCGFGLVITKMLAREI